MKRIQLIVTLAFSLIFPNASLGYTSLTPDDMVQMMRAMASMARMWNAFFELGNWGITPSRRLGFGQPNDGWLEFSSRHSAWPESWSMTGMPNFTGQGPARGGRWRESIGYSPAGSPLEGAWQGLNGEILILRGNQFLIRSPSGQTVHGIFMIYGNRMIAYCVESDNVCRFAFGMRNNMLAFQSESGEILPFRRLNRSLPW